jgi:hypothetical protein
VTLREESTDGWLPALTELLADAACLAVGEDEFTQVRNKLARNDLRADDLMRTNDGLCALGHFGQHVQRSRYELCDRVGPNAAVVLGE